MNEPGQKQLIDNKVLRYKTSGKLVVHGGYGYYLDLDKNYQFNSNLPHKVNSSTELEETDWYIEYEREGTAPNMRFEWVRAYYKRELPNSDKSNTQIALEERINVSPSELLNYDESLYVLKYKKAGSWKTRLIVSILLSALAFYLHEIMGIIVFVIGLAFTIKQFIAEDTQKEQVKLFNEGVDRRKKELLEAKERIRAAKNTRTEQILSDFTRWKQLDGKSFEVATAKLYQKLGYSVKYTPSVNDGGIDLLLEKGPERVGVQCKAYNKNVGVAAVRELHGIKSQWSSLNRFVLVALHGFSRQAVEFANQQDIELYSIERDHFKIG
jgi:hypothetical protein